VDEALALEAIRADLERIVEAAVQTVRAAGLPPERIDVLYLTGGSTGMAALTERLSARFAKARSVQGDRLASVAMGLGVHASRVFGTSTRK
jgi:hypothetical chaperone protein